MHSRLAKTLAWPAMALSLAAIPVHTHAQAWPSAPIRLIVPFEPGGTYDLTGRLLSSNLAPLLGQAVLVENRPGAGGNIATEYVSKQPADGNTVLIAGSVHVINASFYDKLPYDLIKDFDTVSLVTSSALLLSVPAGSAAKTVKEMVALAQAKPEGLTFGSAGVGTPLHFAGEMLKSVTRANFVHVPYKGGGPLGTALLGGHIDFAVTSTAAVLPGLRSGKLRALATMSSNRTPAFPDVPTIAQALGMPGLALETWIGALVPAGTPKAVIARLNAEMNRIVRNPQIAREKLAPIDMEGVGTTPEAFAETIRTDLQKFSKLAKEANIRPGQ